MKYGVKIFLVFCLILFVNSIYSQSDTTKKESKVYPMLEFGVMSGGEVSNGLFIYRNAKVIEGSINVKSDQKVLYGLGAGFESFQKDHFVPVFLQFKGFAKKKTSSWFISVQGGYAFISTNKAYRSLNVETKGGIFFSPGFGYKLKLDKYLILLGMNYKHQFMQIKYNAISEKTYQHEANLHMVSFKAGFVIN